MRISTLIHKELLDIVRDKRTILSMIIIPLVAIPLLIFIVSFFAYAREKRTFRETYTVAINNKIKDNELLKLLKDSKLNILFSSNPSQDIIDKKAKAGLDYKNKTYIVYMDASSKESKVAAERCEKVLMVLKERLIFKKLENYKINKGILTPFEIKKVNVAPPRKLAGLFAGVLLGYLLVIMIFSGATYPAIDATAGEKERRTIEILLSSPATRTEIAMAKLIAVTVVAILSALLYTVSYSITMLTSAKIFIKDPALLLIIKSLPFNLPVIFLLVLTLVPFSFFAASCEVAIASFAKSYKEAQSYLTPLLFIVILPAVISITSPDASINLKGALIPVYNVTQAIKMIMIGELNIIFLIITIMTNIIYAAFGIIATLKVFSNENVLIRG
ncbi:MAG TPA: ABC transporter permease [candidate division WOR-3 bacterium]|uniref:ABC transporter permease n=1 Tax=candidate division WOR-3 bacterium TaxID=2052148 RepID=A0A7C5M281_UNCW3|nr:ABC transporter permease [candidate division WOR-3 bacterium]